MAAVFLFGLGAAYFAEAMLYDALNNQSAPMISTAFFRIAYVGHSALAFLFIYRALTRDFLSPATILKGFIVTGLVAIFFGKSDLAQSLAAQDWFAVSTGFAFSMGPICLCLLLTLIEDYQHNWVAQT